MSGEDFLISSLSRSRKPLYFVLRIQKTRSLSDVDDDYDDGDFTRNNFHSNFRNYKLTERDVNKV